MRKKKLFGKAVAVACCVSVCLSSTPCITEASTYASLGNVSKFEEVTNASTNTKLEAYESYRDILKVHMQKMQKYNTVFKSYYSSRKQSGKILEAEEEQYKKLTEGIDNAIESENTSYGIGIDKFNFNRIEIMAAKLSSVVGMLKKVESDCGDITPIHMEKVKVLKSLTEDMYYAMEYVSVRYTDNQLFVDADATSSKKEAYKEYISSMKEYRDGLVGIYSSMTDYYTENVGISGNTEKIKVYDSLLKDFKDQIRKMYRYGNIEKFNYGKFSSALEMIEGFKTSISEEALKDCMSLYDGETVGSIQNARSSVKTVTEKFNSLINKYSNNPNLLDDKHYITINLDNGSTSNNKLEGYKGVEIKLDTPTRGADKFIGWLVVKGDATVTTKDGANVLVVNDSDSEIRAVWEVVATATPTIPQLTQSPTVEPTATITTSPSAEPVLEPSQTHIVINEPTVIPTEIPTVPQTSSPVVEPTVLPTENPTAVPQITEPVVTSTPIVVTLPTATPTEIPSTPIVVIVTTPEPTVKPTVAPTVPAPTVLSSNTEATPKPDDVDFKVDFYSVTIGEGESINPKASARVNGTEEKIAYSVADEKIATVSENGTIKGVSTGSTQITMKFGKYTKTISVIVKLKPTRISFVKGIKKTVKYTLKKGKKKKVTVWFDKGTYSRKITLKSSNKKVATVDVYGVITAKKKGICKIVAKTYNGKTCYAIIKVK